MKINITIFIYNQRWKLNFYAIAKTASRFIRNNIIVNNVKSNTKLNYTLINYFLISVLEFFQWQIKTRDIILTIIIIWNIIS